MAKSNKIIMLDNEIEAQVFGSLLDEEEIPHNIVSYHDTAYDGLFQMQRGWGHVEAPDEYAPRIEELYEQMKTPD